MVGVDQSFVRNALVNVTKPSALWVLYAFEHELINNKIALYLTRVTSILGFHSRDETAMLVYKTMAK